MTTENTEIDKEMDDVTLDNNASEEQVVADELSVEDQLTQDLYERKDKYLRLFAEFENYKRTSRAYRII
jgi:molecular chaperone GrpE